jgi:hypothetical protein
MDRCTHLPHFGRLRDASLREAATSHRRDPDIRILKIRFAVEVTPRPPGRRATSGRTLDVRRSCPAGLRKSASDTTTTDRILAGPSWPGSTDSPAPRRGSRARARATSRDGDQLETQLAAVSYLASYSGATHPVYAYQLRRWFGRCSQPRCR